MAHLAFFWLLWAVACASSELPAVKTSKGNTSRQLWGLTGRMLNASTIIGGRAQQSEPKQGDPVGECKSVSPSDRRWRGPEPKGRLSQEKGAFPQDNSVLFRSSEVASSTTDSASAGFSPRIKTSKQSLSDEATGAETKGKTAVPRLTHEKRCTSAEFGSDSCSHTQAESSGSASVQQPSSLATSPHHGPTLSGVSGVLPAALQNSGSMGNEKVYVRRDGPRKRPSFIRSRSKDNLRDNKVISPASSSGTSAEKPNPAPKSVTIEERVLRRRSMSLGPPVTWMPEIRIDVEQAEHGDLPRTRRAKSSIDRKCATQVRASPSRTRNSLSGERATQARLERPDAKEQKRSTDERKRSSRRRDRGEKSQEEAMHSSQPKTGLLSPDTALGSLLDGLQGDELLEGLNGLEGGASAARSAKKSSPRSGPKPSDKTAARHHDRGHSRSRARPEPQDLILLIESLQLSSSHSSESEGKEEGACNLDLGDRGQHFPDGGLASRESTSLDLENVSTAQLQGSIQLLMDFENNR